MRLTIIAPDNVFEHEVDPSMEVQDIQALIEAEVSISTLPSARHISALLHVLDVTDGDNV
jgi:hypothetical protein